MTYPTISISLSEERTQKLREIIETLRQQDLTISRSESIGRAIDHFHPIVCTSQSTKEPMNVQIPA